MRVICFTIVWCVSLAAGAGSYERSELEINHLLAFVGGSSCLFNRNGSSHKPAEAREHLKTKYDYFYARGKIQSAEDFITYAATQSSLSGKRYTVSCEGKDIASAEWLLKELNRYRKQ